VELNCRAGSHIPPAGHRWRSSWQEGNAGGVRAGAVLGDARPPAYGAGPGGDIRGGDLLDGFTARDVHQRNWSNLVDRDKVQAALDLLCDLRWLVAVEKRSPAGGRPTTHYTINPKALK
jgi:hypothetical protein